MAHPDKQRPPGPPGGLFLRVIPGGIDTRKDNGTVEHFPPFDTDRILGAIRKFQAAYRNYKRDPHVGTSRRLHEARSEFSSVTGIGL